MSAPASVPVGVQLYSLREEAAADFPAVLERLGAKGFIGVEFAGFYGHSPSDVAARSTARVSQLSSAHVGLAEARRVRGRARRPQPRSDATRS